jgi:putative cell wall-binding protein
MRISRPSVESVLVVANVALAIYLGAVYLTEDRATSRSTVLEAPAQQPEGPPVLVLAGADSPADLVIGRHAAEVLGGAMLAVPARGLTPAMREELVGSRPDRVLVLGSAAIVGDVTARTIEDLTDAPVVRLSGVDRFATAAKVASSQLDPPLERVLVMSGDELDAPGPTQDAAIAAGPLLLVESHRIPADAVAALRRLRPRSIVVQGDASAVSDAVLRQLEDFSAEDVVRLPES